MPEPVDTLDYLTDEQLLRRYDEELERTREQHSALERTQERRKRLFDAKLARGLD